MDVSALLDKVRAYDESLIDYYKTNRVAFCNGAIIDLEHVDPEAIWGAIASRIYSTRNAIVHSKGGDKGKFVPFEHDQLLAREVTLLRFVAELIIIASSTVM